MSKLLILVLILMGIIFIPSLLSDRSSLMFRPNITSVAFGDSIRVKENQKWEYVKSRLFPKGGNVAPKFNGPILISLENATDKQRILVGDIAKEIGELIPNKAISLYKDHTGFTSQEIIDSVSNSSVLNDLFDLYTESISVTFGEKPSPNTDYIRGSRIVFPRLERSVLSDSTVIQRNRNSLIPIKEIAGSILCFNFSNRSDSIKQRNYIKYELLRSLCTVAEDNGFDFNIQNPIQRLNRFNI
jgi:hypothetical protein